MNYYPFHIGDYASATRHLSWDEDLAYRRVLDVYYSSEKPLPVDLRQVCRLVLATTDVQRSAVEVVLSEFFELTPQGWTSARADAEIDAMRDKQQKQRDKANKRWAKPAVEHGNAAAMPQHAEGDAAASKTDAVAMPPTPTPTPINSVPNGTDGKPSEKPTDRDMIFANGVALLTVAGVAEKNARSMLAGLAKTHGDAAVASALGECAKANPVQPVSWLQAFLSPKAKPGKHAGFEKLDYREGVSKDGSLA